MSNFTAVRAVTDTLKSLLVAQMPDIDADEKQSPADVSSITPLVSIYLYRVEQNAFAGTWTVEIGTPRPSRITPSSCCQTRAGFRGPAAMKC